MCVHIWTSYTLINQNLLLIFSHTRSTKTLTHTTLGHLSYVYIYIYAYTQSLTPSFSVHGFINHQKMFVSEQCSICGEGYSLSTSKPENTGHESEKTPAISSSGTRTGDVTRQLSYGHNNRSPFSIPRSFNIRKQTLWSTSPMLSSGSYLLLFVFLMLCMQFHCQGTVQGLSLPEPKSLPMHRISSKDPVSLYTEQDSTNISYKQPTRKTSNDLYMDPCKAGRIKKKNFFSFFPNYH